MAHHELGAFFFGSEGETEDLGQAARALLFGVKLYLGQDLQLAFECF